jgi:hypothetical protein
VLRLSRETCYDFWLTLQPRPEERRRSSLSVMSLRTSSVESVVGKIRVRAMLSSMSASRPRAGPLVQNYSFDYDHLNFKTGDVRRRKFLLFLSFLLLVGAGFGIQRCWHASHVE